MKGRVEGRRPCQQNRSINNITRERRDDARGRNNPRADKTHKQLLRHPPLLNILHGANALIYRVERALLRVFHADEDVQLGEVGAVRDDVRRAQVITRSLLRNSLDPAQMAARLTGGADGYEQGRDAVGVEGYHEQRTDMDRVER